MEITEKQREAYELYQQLGNKSAVARELGLSTTAAEERIAKAKKKMGQLPDRQERSAPFKSPQPQQGGGKPIQNHGGMSRDEARQAYDIPHRLSTALDEFLKSMTPGYLYEENEVKRACKVSNNEAEYWNSITAMHAHRPFYGFTETGARLWGTKADIEWAAGTDGITGFVPGEDANWN